MLWSHGWARRAAPIACVGLLVVGCGANSSTSPASVASASAPHHRTGNGRERRHAGVRSSRRGRRGRGGPRAAPAGRGRPASATLAASAASPSAIQPQPAPGSCHARGSGLFSLPDLRCTPGAIDPTVTQANIDSTICRYGYTDRVRPPEWITEPEKHASLASYGDTAPIYEYEYDHLVPLELGGARNDPRNLWPEPGPSPNPKDELEDRLHQLVCDGQVTLVAAQLAIARNWVATYRRLVG
jgi:hypothetical protein